MNKTEQWFTDSEIESASRPTSERPVSIVREIAPVNPLYWLEAGERLGFRTRRFWQNADNSLTLVGLGQAEQVDGTLGQLAGYTGFGERDLPSSGTSSNATGTVWLGGFRFASEASAARTDSPWAAWPSGRMVRPRWLLTVDHGRYWLSLNPGRPIDSEQLLQEQKNLYQVLWRLEQDQPEFARQAVVHIGAIDAPAWIRSVDDLVAEIRRGLVDKVVLARPIEAWQEHDWKLSAVASALIEHQPSTYRFLMMDGDETFVGASPETLLAAAGNQIRTVCLAGSAPRSADPDLDARLGSALLHDAKNQKEHAIVVQYVGDVLRSMAEAVTLSPVHVKKWPDLQHLETTVEAQLRTDFSILRVAAALHPTPAVLGYPREQAWAAMRRYEHWDRGWYAGPVGWMNGVGEGEFAVAIRSALLAGTHAWLFSGAGIVGDSSGAREFEETEWKAQTMIQVLEGRRRE